MNISQEVQNFLLQNKNEILSFFKSADPNYLKVVPPVDFSSGTENLSNDDNNQSSEREEQYCTSPRTCNSEQDSSDKICLASNVEEISYPIRFFGSSIKVKRDHSHRSHLSKLSSSVCKKPCRCVGVFGMSRFTDERDLLAIFSQFGKIEKINIIRDRYNQRSRGFGFVYLRTTKEAQNAVRSLVGVVIDGHKVRIDYSYSTVNPSHR